VEIALFSSFLCASFPCLSLVNNQAQLLVFCKSFLLLGGARKTALFLIQMITKLDRSIAFKKPGDLNISVGLALDKKLNALSSQSLLTKDLIRT